MGIINRKRLTNIFDVPKDILMNFIGRGLNVDREEILPMIEVSTGKCLLIDEESNVSVDLEADESKESIITVCSDVKLGVDGRKISLTKVYQDFKLVKTKDGIVTDLMLINTRTYVDESILTDYGYIPCLTIPQRESSDELPNFYKK